MMKLRKFCLPLCLALALTVLPGISTNAEILQKGSQAVDCTGTSDGTGVLNLDNLTRIMPNGTTQPMTIPAGQVLVITHVIWRISGASVNGAAELQIGPYYSSKATISGGVAMNLDNQAQGTGIVVAKGNGTNTARVVTLPGGATETGTLFLRMVGYFASPQ
jgi:hypothetical protein